MPDPIRFTLNGTRLELSRAQVEMGLTHVAPQAIRKHAVHVGASWYPVRQAFGAATGLDGDEFTSHTARRHLAALGFEISGTVEPRSAPPAPGPRPPDVPKTRAVDESWHTEANVQAAVVRWLATDEWRVLSVANTATREHGVDVVATRGEETVGVEVKGFPSRGYADPSRAAEAKRTQPSTQAGHWYAQAVLAAMRLRGRQPELRSVIALPDFPRYRNLHAETRESLDASGIETWWVGPDGAVATG